MLAGDVAESGWIYKACDPDKSSSFRDCNVRPQLSFPMARNKLKGFSLA